MHEKLAQTDFVKDLLETMNQRGFGTLPGLELAVKTLALIL